MRKLTDMINNCKLALVACLTLAGCNEDFYIPAFIVLGTAACFILGYMAFLYKARDYYYNNYVLKKAKYDDRPQTKQNAA